MQAQVRIVLLWLIIVLCFFIHGYYHLAEIFFDIDIKVEGADGKVPLATHLFSVLIEIVPLTLAVLHLYRKGKIFLWISLVFAGLLAILNLVHLGATVWNEVSDIRQIALLAFIPIVNLVLVKEIYRFLKEPVSA